MVSLFGPWPIRNSIILMFSPCSYSHSQSSQSTSLTNAGAHTGAHLSSLQHCLQEKPTWAPKGKTHFSHHSHRRDGATLFPLRCQFCILKIIFFCIIRGGHSAPSSYAWFQQWVFLLSCLSRVDRATCHSPFCRLESQHYSLYESSTKKPYTVWPYLSGVSASKTKTD